MKKYTVFDSPVEVHGVPFFNERKTLKRLPPELMEKIPTLKELGQKSPGVRVIFRTNAAEIKFHMELENTSTDIGSGLFQRQSSHIMVGNRGKGDFRALLTSYDYTKTVAETTLKKSSDFEDVTVWLPTSEVIRDFRFEIDDLAEVVSPTPYEYSSIVYYGSSITEAVNISSAANSYSGIISERLNADYYNLGFPSNAKGESEMAEFIASIPDMCVFVYDYDHNAPSLEHLENTHETFFKIIREKRPDLPVIMLTRPNIENSPDYKERREIVRRTYQNALAQEDGNVWFIDGETLFGESERYLCTIDRTHPNDLGAWRMAEKITPVIKEALLKITK